MDAGRAQPRRSRTLEESSESVLKKPGVAADRGAEREVKK